MHALIDLETMGNGSHAAIVAIGGVKFDPYADGLSEDEFYTAVDLESSMRIGMQVDASTIKWWLMQSDAARQALLTDEAVDILDALTDFSVWYRGAEKFWCRGATFDAVILGNAYTMLAQVKAPWSFRDVMDVRVLEEITGLGKTKVGGVEHHALDDARRHALDVQAAYRKLGLKRG
jgi:hypothetical protein